MLLAWMAYSTLFGCLAYASAAAVDRALAAWNYPRRFVWLAALVVATAIPAWLAVRPSVDATPATRGRGSPNSIDISFAGATAATHPLSLAAIEDRARNGAVNL